MADIVVTVANVLQGTNANVKLGTAGATITAGQVVYVDATDSDKIKLADADSSEATAAAKGIALHGSLTGQPIRYQTGGDINPGGTVVVGTSYYVSGNAGGIAPQADVATADYVTLLGIGDSATNIAMQIIVSGVTVPA